MYRPPPGSYPPAAYGGPPVPPQAMVPNGQWQAPGGMPPMPPAAIWKEHTTPEGRKYWYNNVTRQSTWEKPDDLLTPEERVFKSSNWKEYTTPEGKKYYSNSVTKQTVWEVPEELREQLEQAKRAASVPNEMPHPAPSHTMQAALATPLSAQFTQAAPEYATKEEAEKAFFGLLKETGVKSDWTWDQAMRAIITKPLYRALKTIGERKAAFHQWADAEAKREREEREQKEARQKNNFFNMLKQKDMKPYTRFRTAVKLCGHLSAFNAVPERQREIYFEEYIQNMQREEKDRMRDLRKESMDKFSRLLRSIPEITYKTSWKEAQDLYKQYQHNTETFEGMDMLDFLSVFEEYNRQLWEEPLNELNGKIHARRRRDRKAREGFRELMHELVAQRKINVRTLWKEIFPIIKDDPRYLAAVGSPDSTPLDMFWDVIDDLDEQLYHQKKTVYNALKKADLEVSLDTSFEEYLKAVQADARVREEVNQDNLRFIYEHLLVKAEQRIKDEKRRQEKKLRKKLDIFRHALKHALQPPIQLEDTWETIKPRVEHMPEYHDVQDEALKQEVFDKYMKRLAEKMENGDEEEEEEGMIREDEEGMIREDEEMRGSSSRRHRRKDYDSESEEYRNKKRRKRHSSKGFSSAEEGEALDDYQNDPRRK
ncbi:unnamed protein product [Mucor circinelloides]|uniref:Pre-mRNA-processing factor 40 n=1 Tax=Mucor circinelloides f. circinelloides (strain 1006PhL) TaxID=1220926 RepID=S2J0G8_MUCC1|nr:hypothetical protein HMPREF1544_09712 [Mucor circinelloides 1006PhL]